LVLIFKGYRSPLESPGKFQLIVKALLLKPKDGIPLRVPLLTFKEFRPDGIVLSITDLLQPVQPPVLQQLSVMVEISRFEAA
jgi:hypothetical protein